MLLANLVSQQLIDQIPRIFIFHNSLLFRGDAFFKMWCDYHLTFVIQTIYKELFSVFFIKPWPSHMIPSYQLSEPWYIRKPSYWLHSPQRMHTTRRQGSAKNMGHMGKHIWVQILVQLLIFNRNWGKSHSFWESHITHLQIQEIANIAEFHWILNLYINMHTHTYICH